MDRIGIFIDGGYLASLLREDFGGAPLDFGRLVQEVAQGREVFRTYYYDCLPHRSTPPTSEENERYAKRERFHRALNHIPRFEVRLGKLIRETTPDGKASYRQKRVDVLLAVDLVRHAAQRVIQYAALIGGDSDFVPAVEVAKNEGVIVTLYHGRTRGRQGGTVSDELYVLCDERVGITQALIDKCPRQGSR